MRASALSCLRLRGVDHPELPAGLVGLGHGLLQLVWGERLAPPRVRHRARVPRRRRGAACRRCACA
ncbi:MAG TPA: hypothetical protein PK096_02360 [Candidatus Saccharibacteria bacterium]|nr:hypothetical protein [Candidatus Saccharibacteria bacterium]